MRGRCREYNQNPRRPRGCKGLIAMDIAPARIAPLLRMVDEVVVSFSVAAGFLAAVPLCAVQGSLLVEWSPDLFLSTWLLAFLAVYPFVCALLNARYLLASPGDASKAAASERMETVTVVAGAFGVLCAAALVSTLRLDTTSPGGLAAAGLGMVAGLIWYAASRILPRGREGSTPALAFLLAASAVFGLIGTVGAGFSWKVLVLLYPLNLLLVLAKLVRRSRHRRNG